MITLPMFGGAIAVFIGAMILLEMSGIFPAMRAAVKVGTEAADEHKWTKREKRIVLLIILTLCSFPFALLLFGKFVL